MAEGAIDAEAVRHVDHERIGLLRRLDRRTIGAGKRLRRGDANGRLAVKQRRQWIALQRARAVDVVGVAKSVVRGGETRRARGARIGVPDVGRHGISTVTRVASHARVRDMRLPVHVDVPRHLQHLARDLLGVEAVIGEILDIVAIGAALFRRDPFRDRQHDAIELVGAEILQHLHVAVNLGRLVAIGRGLVDRVWQGVRELEHALDLGPLDLGHRGAAIAILGNMGAFNHPAQLDEHGHGHEYARYRRDITNAQIFREREIWLHLTAPATEAGSMTGGKTCG